MRNTVRRFLATFTAILRLTSLKSEIPKLLGFTLALNLVFGVGFYLAERGVQKQLSISDAFWWAIATTTTVGYGDFSAVTPVGRYLIAYPLMIIGIGAIGYLVGLVATAILEYTSRHAKGLVDMTYEKHVVICNYPSEEKLLGITAELRFLDAYRDSHFVLVTDTIEVLPEVILKDRIDFIRGNPTQESVLMRANVLESKGVFILASDPKNLASDERSFAVATVIKTLASQHQKAVRTVVELVSKSNRGFLAKSGADSLVSSEGVGSSLLVQEFLYQGVGDVFAQLLSNSVGSQLYIFDSRLQGFKLRDIQKAVLDHETDMQVIGIIKGEKKILNPSQATEIGQGDRLIMLAENPGDFEAVQQQILKSSGGGT